MPSVNWNTPGSLAYAGAQRVYIRQRWADSWSLQPNIFCTQATWSLLPSMPVAQFEMDYGRVLPHGGINWTTQAKIEIGGWYVKVEFDCADGVLTWYGFIDDVADEQGGIEGSLASGTLRWVAYGMPQILGYEYLTRCRWHDQPNSENRWSGSAINFNDSGKPNRTETKPTADPDKEQVHLFAPVVPKNINDYFSTPWNPAKTWSSRDIVDYLEQHAMPLDENEAVAIPFRIDNKDLLPTWDKPTIETEGKPILAILEELINPSRLLQMSTGIDGSTTPETVVLKLHSLSASRIMLPDSNIHEKNSDALTITAFGGHDTKVTVQKSETASVNQIVVKGAKRQSVATVSAAATGEALVPGWDPDEESDYEDGASNEAGYGALSDEEKRKANHLARASEKLRDVYRTLVINPEWDFDIGSLEFLFENEDFSRYFPWFDAINIAPVLPLKEGEDYTGTLPDDDDATPERRQPYILFKRPGTDEYIQAERIATKDGDPVFSVEVGSTKDGKGITLNVIGGEQHDIAKTNFTALPVDDSVDWDYLDAKYTLAWTEDRYAEYVYPETPPGRDVVRRKIIYAGDAYTRIRIQPTTVVSTDVDGSTESVASAGWLTRDDEGPLQSIGQIASVWHGVTRQVLRIVSARPSATPVVGQLVGTVNPSTPHQEVINSVITEISLSLTRDEILSPAQYSLVTSAGELDPLAFVPNNQGAV